LAITHVTDMRFWDLFDLELCYGKTFNFCHFFGWF